MKTNKDMSAVCYQCDGNMRFMKTDESFTVGDYTLTLQGLSGYVCENCGEKMFTAEETNMIQRLLYSFQNSKNDRPDILNLDETAKLLRVSNQTIYNMIRDGRLKAFKVGREWRFLKKDIEGAATPVDRLPVAAKGGEVDSDDLSVILDALGEISDE